MVRVSVGLEPMLNTTGTSSPVTPVGTSKSIWYSPVKPGGMPENRIFAGKPPTVMVGVVTVSYNGLPLAGATWPVVRGVPLGSPLGVARPSPVAYRTRMSPGLAGCPHTDKALKLVWQTPGKDEPGIFCSAVAMETG